MAEAAELLKRLKAERERLAHELEQLKSEEKEADEQREGSPFGKREEGATETFELEKRLAIERKLKNALVDVDNAIKKFESGTYGICDICKKAIESARLEALPQANLCLKCRSRKMKDARYF